MILAEKQASVEKNIETGLIIYHNSGRSIQLEKSGVFLLFSFKIYLFIYIFGCARAFSSCSERGLLFVSVRGLLIAVASPVAEHGLQARGPQ